LFKGVPPIFGKAFLKAACACPFKNSNLFFAFFICEPKDYP